MWEDSIRKVGCLPVIIQHADNCEFCRLKSLTGSHEYGRLQRLFDQPGLDKMVGVTGLLIIWIEL